MIVYLDDILGDAEGNATPCHAGDGIAFIYHLILDGKIVYVGRTTNLKSRLAAHHAFGKKFDSARFYHVPADNAGNAEASDIMTIKPPLNKSIPKNDLFISLSSFKKEVASLFDDCEMFEDVFFGSSKGGSGSEYTMRYAKAESAMELIRSINECVRSHRKNVTKTTSSGGN